MAALFVLSACGTSAGGFFGSLLARKADLVLDVRLKNTNQLCGFTRQKDLEYLVPALTGAEYIHDLRFAPEPDQLAGYLAHRIGWEEFRAEYIRLIGRRKAAAAFHAEYGRCRSVCLLGAASGRRRSHSEVLAELLSEAKGE